MPKQEGTARKIESMQQSSATPKTPRCREGIADDCCMLLAVPSCSLALQTLHVCVKTIRELVMICGIWKSVHVQALSSD